MSFSLQGHCPGARGLFVRHQDHLLNKEVEILDNILSEEDVFLELGTFLTAVVEFSTPGHSSH